jgi:hypothetical protein
MTVMILSPEPNYPSARRYVLKLHRDAVPARGRLIGRLENMVSGHSFDFSNAQQLLLGLAQDVALAEPQK